MCIIWMCVFRILAFPVFLSLACLAPDKWVESQASDASSAATGISIITSDESAGSVPRRI